MAAYSNWNNWRGNAVNIPVASPATERYPGAVDPQVYTEDYPGPFAIEGPVAGSYASPFGAHVPSPGSGGGILDATYLTGTDAPEVAWDSAGGIPVQPNLSYPGALPPGVHAENGSGAVAAAQTVVPAYIGKLIRRSASGQTYNREYAFDPVNGGNVPQPNGRVNFDQIQEWDPSPGDGGGHDPWDVPYAERPVFLNVAFQNPAVTSAASPYGVSGDLPDRSVWNEYQAQSYEAPPDPIVNQPAAPSGSYAGRWVLG